MLSRALEQQEYDNDPFENRGGLRNSVILKHINNEGDTVVQEVDDIFRMDVETENPLCVDYRQRPIVRCFFGMGFSFVSFVCGWEFSFLMEKV